MLIDLNNGIFSTWVDQSKVGKVFPCLVLKVVHSGIGDHLGVFFMMMMVKMMMMMVMMIKPNDKEMMRMIKKVKTMLMMRRMTTMIPNLSLMFLVFALVCLLVFCLGLFV